MASVTPRKNKAGIIISYQIKVSRGRDPLTGKQLTPFTTTYTPPEGWSPNAIKRDLQRIMGEFEAACKRGEVFTKDQQREELERQKIEAERKPTFEKYVEIFLDESKVTRAPNTIENYRIVLRKASEVFGTTKLEDIDFLAIKGYMTALRLNGKNDFNGKPLAHATVLKHHIVLHKFFVSAVENKVIKENPMKDLKRPQPRKDEKAKEPTAFSEAEVRHLLECLASEPLKWRAMILTILDSGIRRGEAVGLKWEDIDLQTGKVEIRNNAQYTAGIGNYVTAPKNGKSRTIYLNGYALSVLKAWKREQSIFLLGQGIAPSGFCFTRENGQMMNPQAPTDYLKAFRKKYDIKKRLYPHCLRHTMATLSIANGADIVSISEKLGHADTSITLNVYSHVNAEAQKRSNQVFAQAVYGAGNI